MSTATTNMVLSDRLWDAQGAALWIKRAILLVAGVAALTVSAKIQILTQPVPVTLQMLVVMVIGAAYGPKLGAATVASYIALGLQGLPVFAGAVAGPAYVLGATGGYLLGFMIAAYAVGALASAGWDRSPLRMAAAMAVGILCVYIPGVMWLSAGAALLGGAATAAVSGFVGGEAFTGYGWANWYAYGVKTFIWVDALKLVVAVIAFPAIWKLVGDARG
ncbi:biotin transporter BioY [Pseudooctadecabacter sp.]|uniref:biotin transporter BioY n=1 Tax=Pseudooctadecabacter sp. TaxID=1966338 RepID=UPI0025EFDFFE|nr:biotin transporter BioY [Pseudooctadecabacter sp.]